MIGFGALLGGHSMSTGPALERLYGAVITSVRIDPTGDGRLVFETHRGGVVIQDNGRSCCESRYMTCDDDLASFGGAVVITVEVRDGSGRIGGRDDEHEIQFLVVTTDKGVITVATHNEHNGYYGGFALVARCLT